MYCPHCGTYLVENAAFCVRCGNRVSSRGPTQRTTVVYHSPYPAPAPVYVTMYQTPSKSMLTTVLLWLFLGAIGAHRFYLGHTCSGILMLCCLCTSFLIYPLLILSVWWILDIILIVSGALGPTDGSELV